MKVLLKLLLSLFLLGQLLYGCNESTQQSQIYLPNDSEGETIYVIVNSAKSESERLNLADTKEFFDQKFEEALQENNMPLAAHFKTIGAFQVLTKSRGIDVYDRLEEAYKFAVDHGEIRTQIYALKSLADYHSRYGDSNLALGFIKSAEELLSEIDDIDYTIMILGTKAQIYDDVNRRVEAYELYQSTLELLEELDKKRNISVLRNSMGLLLLDMGLYEESLESFQKAHQINHENNYTTDLQTTYNNVPLALKELSRFEEAIDTLRVAIQFNLEVDAIFGVIQNYYNLGSIYIDLQEYENAIREFETGLEMSVQTSFPYGLMYNNFGLSKSRNFMGNYAEGLSYASSALEIGLQLGAEEILNNVYRELYISYKELGQLEDALEAYLTFTELDDKLKEERRGIDLQEIHTRYMVRERESENQMLIQEVEYQTAINKNQKVILLLFGIIMVLLAISTIVIYTKQKYLRKSLKIIEEQKENLYVRNQKIEKLYSERKALMGVIVHDLKNPIAAISGFIELVDKKNLNKDDQDYINYINQANDRMKSLVNSLLGIHELENKSHIAETTVESVTETFKNIITHFSKKAFAKNIEFKTNIDDVWIEINYGHLKRIVENLLSNAIKFSQPDTSVNVDLYVDDQDMLHLIVSDEGPGFTEKDLESVFKMLSPLSARPTANEDSDGIGLYTVKLLTEQLNGNVSIQNNETKGATISCILPVKRVDAPVENQPIEA